VHAGLHNYPPPPSHTYTQTHKHLPALANRLPPAPPPSLQHLGQYSFKGVSGMQSVVCVNLARLQGRTFPNRLRRWGQGGTARGDIAAMGQGAARAAGEGKAGWAFAFG
jgi:hypothetical protein